MTPEEISSYIDNLRDRGVELEAELADPAIYAKPEECRRVSQEHRKLEALFRDFDSWVRALKEIAENREMLSAESDAGLRELIEADIAALDERSAELEGKIQLALLPPDPNDDKNIIVEIKPAAGGDEAALFAGELLRAYLHFAERQEWKVEVLDESQTDLGGIKNVSFSISGAGVFSLMKYESGVHRVQRVPETESGGRVHTSTATVAVLPEMDEASVDIRPEDIKMDVYRASGAGGQHVNKTSSAVRLTHIPTGTVVACQEERSQAQNRQKAMNMLASILYQAEQERIQNAYTAERKSQVGTGMRNERIRTYNYPQGRVTDHRIGLTLYQIDSILNGDLDQLIDPLITADQAEKLLRSESQP